jgi:nitrogen regulatory protein P-II 1
MQRVEAIIRLSEFADVKDALDAVGITGLTLSRVKGFGRTGGNKDVYWDSAGVVDVVSCVKIEVVVADGQVESILHAIEHGAKTGKIGDGKIFVTNVPDAVRIRTGEHGEQAL